ncbi:MAG: hypothetical protein R3C05_09700 [Pirellulaceae bacterium]
MRAFIDNNKEHPRLAEARLQLGKVLLTRGVVLIETGKDEEESLATARQSLDAAAVVFDTIVEDLRSKLSEMQGTKIKPDDSEALALRDRYRGEFLQAFLMSGDVRERAADTLAQDAPERNKRYDEALAKYKELAEKYSDKLPGAQSAFYIGRIAAKKGDVEAALQAFQNTLKQPDVEELRMAKTDAAARAVQIYMSKSPPMAKEAVSLAGPWMDGLRPNERSLPEWQRLRVALAEAYLAVAGSEKPAEAKKLQGKARALLIAATKVPGGHMDQARTLLAAVGVDTSEAEATQIEPPKSYSEALVACRELLDAAKSEALPIQMLREDIDRGGENRDQLKQQLAETETSVQQKYAAASKTIQHGFTLINSEDTQQSINQGRFYLALAESNRKRYWEAAVVGEFVARRFPTDALALQCGLAALGAYQSMLLEADEEKQPAVMRKIEPLALFLAEKWPDDPNATAAANLLVQISLLDKRWEDAEKHLVRIPADSPSRSQFQCLLGQSLWNEYQQQLQAEQVDEANKTLQRSMEQLQAGVEGTRSDDVSNVTLLSALLLAKAKLEQGDAAGALQHLKNENYGPLKRTKGEHAVKSLSEGLVADSYRTALQAVVSQLKKGGNGDALLPEAKGLVDDLRNALSSEPNAEKRLVGIFSSLAKDIRKQIDKANPGERDNLIDAVQLFLEKVGEQSSDTTTDHWVAQTFIEMGEAAMGSQRPPATGKAKGLMEAAAKQLKTLIEGSQQDAEAVRQMRFELATTSRLMGDYGTAINELHKILQEQNTMVDAQIQAALSFQQWAMSPGFNPKYVKGALDNAISGAKPDRSGKHAIWGWTKLAKLTQGKPAYEATFFDARYRIAECLLQKGLLSPDSGDKEKYAAQSEKVVQITKNLYPELGGPADYKRNDELVRQAQLAQGKAVTGL